MRTVVDELIDWLWHEGRLADLEAPQALHARHPTPEDRSELPLNTWIGRRETQKARAGIIVGRPFTRQFERYLDGQRAMTPARRALFRLNPPKNARKPFEYRVVWAVFEGGHGSAEAVAALLRCEVAAVERAISLLVPRMRDMAEKIEIEDDHNRGDHANRLRDACPICRRLLEAA